MFADLISLYFEFGLEVWTNILNNLESIEVYLAPSLLVNQRYYKFCNR